MRQCFLFSNHLIIATRTSGGRLHLLQDVGKIPLADATLVEDPSDSEREDEDASLCSASNQGSCLSVNESSVNRDFKLLVENKSGTRHCVHLVAPTVQDKEAWISDISQCVDNIHMHSMLSPGLASGLTGKCTGPFLLSSKFLIPIQLVGSMLWFLLNSVWAVIRSGCSEGFVACFNAVAIRLWSRLVLLFSTLKVH